MKTKTSNDLFSIADVCSYYGLSEATIRRKVKESRDGKGNFPLPLFKSGCRVLWKRADILAWGGEDADTIEFNALSIPPTLQAAPTISDDRVRRGLQRYGIDPPSPEGTKSSPTS